MQWPIKNLGPFPLHGFKLSLITCVAFNPRNSYTLKLKISANGRNNSKHCRELLRPCWQSGVQTDATASNNVETCGASWEGYNLCNPCLMCVRGPNNVGRAVQMDPTSLRNASAITEQKKCWQLFSNVWPVSNCATTLYNTQQHLTRTQHVTSKIELLASNVTFVCTGLSVSCFV